VGVKANPLSGIDHGFGEPFHLLAVHVVNVGCGDISRELDFAEVVVHNILDNGPDLVFCKLLPVHEAFDVAERGWLGGRKDIHLGGVIQILHGLCEYADLSRLDHLHCGVQDGGGGGSLCPHPHPVSGIQSSLSGFGCIEHDFMLAYLDIKGTDLQHVKRTSLALLLYLCIAFDQLSSRESDLIHSPRASRVVPTTSLRPSAVSSMTPLASMVSPGRA